MIRLNNTQRKRMRSTSPEREGGGDILAHPLPYEGLWFEDGNVVVVAEKSAFKVHLGVLARHSEFFRDMFKLPQATPTCGETMDGLPIIPLPDTETDAVNLLLPMYSCGCSENFRADVSIPLSVVLSMLRMGRKYEVPRLFEEAVRRLKFCFPTTLRGLDAFRAAKILPIQNVWDGDVLFKIINTIQGPEFEPELDYLLPSAFFACTLLDNKTLLKAARDDAMTINFLDAVFGGRQRLTSAFLREDQLFAGEDLPRCVQWGLNCQTTPALHQTIKGVFVKVLTANDPFIELERFLRDEGARNGGICTLCIADIVARYNRGRAEVWKTLPSLFGLEIAEGWPRTA